MWDVRGLGVPSNEGAIRIVVLVVPHRGARLDAHRSELVDEVVDHCPYGILQVLSNTTAYSFPDLVVGRPQCAAASCGMSRCKVTEAKSSLAALSLPQTPQSGLVVVSVSSLRSMCIAQL